MIELFTLIFGGALRFAPELLKWFDKRDERKHELAMFDKQLEADKLRGALAVQQIDAQGAITIAGAEIQALIEGAKAQAVQTGIKWVDAVNSLMRPLITVWWAIVLYTGVLICQYVSLRAGGEGAVNALLALWGPAEKAIVGSIIGFWFMDRALRKGAGK